MFKELNKFFYDKNFRIIIFDRGININNYDEVLLFESNKILIRIKDKIIKITGENLTIKRFENKEIFISGIINNINMGD